MKSQWSYRILRDGEPFGVELLRSILATLQVQRDLCVKLDDTEVAVLWVRRVEGGLELATDIAGFCRYSDAYLWLTEVVSNTSPWSVDGVMGLVRDYHEGVSHG